VVHSHFDEHDLDEGEKSYVVFVVEEQHSYKVEMSMLARIEGLVEARCEDDLGWKCHIPYQIQHDELSVELTLYRLKVTLTSGDHLEMECQLENDEERTHQLQIESSDSQQMHVKQEPQLLLLPPPRPFQCGDFGGESE